ncbi:MAG: hypothetical protein AABY22_10395 [Nanoarchaeota archaeon]
MGCRIIKGYDERGDDFACFYDSVTDVVFGTKMLNLEEAEDFQKWVKEQFKKDLRELSHQDFVRYLNEFRTENGK